MARGEEPLLARPSSENSSERNIEEEDALLTGQSTQRSPPAIQKWREAGLFIWALLATILVIVLAVVYQHESSLANSRPRTGGWGENGRPAGKRNMIFMVSDGMGPASLTLTRTFKQYTEGLPAGDLLVLDKHLIGTSRTRSTSSLITDSAAGATAFSCGLKSYNGAISVLPDHSPCGTVMEAAKRAGYLTGLVVTTRVTDATPACFASHANKREYEDMIAEQEIGNYPLGRTVDLILGGGRCHFLPNTTSGSCRADDHDVVAMARKNGFNYINNREDFDNLGKTGSGVKLPFLGLMADRDIPYEIDRVHASEIYPSQEEMTRFALKALSAATKDQDQGFFVLIEGSRIDHAGHANDPATQIHEVLAHDSAFAAVLEFLDNDENDGVLVSTSDHETGGLATAKQLHTEYPLYHWFPGALANATHSSEFLGHQYWQYLQTGGENANRLEKRAFIRSKLLSEGLEITDATDDEVDAIIDATVFWPSSYLFADMISRRAQIGWTTHGHSGVDVNIYASHPTHAPPLVGNHENTEIGKFIAEYLDLDLESITQELKQKSVDVNPAEPGPVEGSGWGEWMGPLDFSASENADLVYLDEYHGDFKHRKRGAEFLQDCGCGLKH